ncbi:MAG: NAD(P)/FAD-dependent oxidoreductase [Synergistaceae bacterium]|nr:NAD(P)/FAD-dependent oxidoreductase [Synergistaceae bacterium]
MDTYEVIIIGAGIVGNSIARELSRFSLKVAVLEKELDVAFGTSSRNSGVIHSGINYEPGTLRALLNVKGNAMMDKLCSELKVPIKRIGKLTVALDSSDLSGLHRQKEQGDANGVPGMELMDNETMRKIQPGINGILGLWTPSSGIISPYLLTIALAENAHLNGTAYHLNSKVVSITRSNGFYEVSTESGKTFICNVLINAAGLHSDEISGMIGLNSPEIWACRGEYYVLDKRLSNALKTLIYPVPGPNDPGLGIHLTPTVDGNILIGPSATYIPNEDREDYRTTAKIMSTLREEGEKFLPGIKLSDFIRSFSGNRPKLTPPDKGGNSDFRIKDCGNGYIELVGIESPGLTSSPAIAEMVRDMVEKYLKMTPKKDFRAERPGFAGFFSSLPYERKTELIKKHPEYGEIFCRCEGITKKEIRDAIENPLGTVSLTGIKLRSRAMMGRCQGGFCIPRIVKMLRDDYGYEPDQYMLRNKISPMFSGLVRSQ